VKIASVADLERLGGPAFTPRRPSVELAIPGVPASELEGLARRLRASVSSCGCTESAMALLCGVGIVTAAHLAVSGVRPPSLYGAAAGTSFVIAAAAMGKFIGLLSARLRHRRLVAEIRNVIVGAAAQRSQAGWLDGVQVGPYSSGGTSAWAPGDAELFFGLRHSSGPYDLRGAIDAHIEVDLTCGGAISRGRPASAGDAGVRSG